MDIKLPKIIEYTKTKTLDKGRVETTLRLFMLDAEVVDSIVKGFAAGEISMVEMRVGTTIKHPKDKYDKTVAKAEAAKKLKKVSERITRINIDNKSVTIVAETVMIRKYTDNGKIVIYS